MGVVVDSGVFIRWEREGRGIDFSKWVFFGEPFVSVVTVSELKVGIHPANTIERRAKRSQFVATILSCVSVLDIDSAVADLH
jgi:tRNA(fMet)-specific endonuclease VapC